MCVSRITIGFAAHLVVFRGGPGGFLFEVTKTSPVQWNVVALEGPLRMKHSPPHIHPLWAVSRSKWAVSRSDLIGPETVLVKPLYFDIMQLC